MEVEGGLRAEGVPCVITKKVLNLEMADKGGSSGDGIDSEDDSNNNHYYTSSLIPKLQFRKENSKAYWKEGICMFEVIESRGQLWTTTGIIRDGKTLCSLEEILYMAEMGGISVFLDQNEKIRLSLKDMYKMLEAGEGSSSLHSFLAYKHLKSLGYVLLPPSTTWITKNSQSSGDTCGDTSAATDVTADRNRSHHDMWRSAATVDNENQSWGETWKTVAVDTTDAADNDGQSGGDMWHILATDIAVADDSTHTVDNDSRAEGDTWQIIATGIVDSSNSVDEGSQSGGGACHIAVPDIATDGCTDVVDNIGQLEGDMCRIATLDIAATDDFADNDSQSGGDMWITVSTNISTNIVDDESGNTYVAHDCSQSRSDTCKCSTTNTAAATGGQSCGNRWKDTSAFTMDDYCRPDADTCKTTTYNHGESCRDIWKAATAVTPDGFSRPHPDTSKTTADNRGESCCDKWKPTAAVTDLCKTGVTNQVESCRDRCKAASSFTSDDCGRPHADMCKPTATDHGESYCDMWKTGSQLCGDRWKSLMPIYKVFMPNSKFSKSSPGEPAFLLCLCRGRHPPPLYSTEEVEEAQRLWPDLPLKLCRVHSGRPFFFSFHNPHLPILP